MQADKFWSLIEQSRARGKSCEAVSERLQKVLAGLTPEDIIAFDTTFSQLMIQAYRWDLWAVAHIANGGCSDDGFEYFRAWLIGQGRERFESALTTPELALEKVKPGDDVECEDLLYVASTVYEEKMGGEMPAREMVFPDAPTGTQWEEDELPTLYPKLSARFD